MSVLNGGGKAGLEVLILPVIVIGLVILVLIQQPTIITVKHPVSLHFECMTMCEQGREYAENCNHLTIKSAQRLSEHMCYNLCNRIFK